MAHVLRVLRRAEARQAAVSRSSFVPAVRARRHRALTPPRSLAAGVRASRDVRPVDCDGRVVRRTGRVAADDVAGDLQATTRDCGVVAEHEVAADVVVRRPGSTTARRSRTRRVVAGHDQIAADRVRLAGRSPAQLLPIPIPRLTVLFVIRRSRPTVRLQRPSNTNGKPGEPRSRSRGRPSPGPPGVSGALCPVCTVCGFDANRSWPIVTLSRCMPPPRPEQLHVVPDRRPQDVGARRPLPRPTKSCPIDESVMPAPEPVPPATMSCPTVDSEMSAPAKSPKVRSLPMLVLTISAPASSRWIMSCVIVASDHDAEASFRDDQVVSRARERERVLRADDVRRSRCRARERHKQARRDAATTTDRRHVLALSS